MGCMPHAAKSPLDRLYVFWPDGTYSICNRQRGEWMLRLPDWRHVGAPRLLTLWRIVASLDGRFARI